MAKKDKPKKENMATDEVKRHMNVLIEHVEKKIKVIADQYDSIAGKLESHDKRFDRMETAIMENGMQIKSLKVGQKKLEEGYKKLEQKLDADIKRVENKLGTDIKRVENKLGTDIKRVENKLDTALDNHEKRIQKLEHKVGV